MPTNAPDPSAFEFRASVFRGRDRCPGRVRLAAGRVSFVPKSPSDGSSALVADLPLEGLQCELTGFDHGSFVLRHASEPEVQVVVDDARFAEHPAVQDHPTITAARAARRQKIRKFRASSALILGCLLVAVAGGVAAAAVLVRALVHSLLG